MHYVMERNLLYLVYLKISQNLQKDEIVGIYTQKGEVVGLAQSTMSGEDIQDATKGYAFETKRLIMKPNTYPKSWRTKPNKDNVDTK